MARAIALAVTHLSGNHGRPNAAASGGIRVLKEEAEKLQDLSNLPKSSYPQNVAQFLGNKLPKSLVLKVNLWRSGRDPNVSPEASQCVCLGGHPAGHTPATTPLPNPTSSGVRDRATGSRSPSSAVADLRPPRVAAMRSRRDDNCRDDLIAPQRTSVAVADRPEAPDTSDNVAAACLKQQAEELSTTLLRAASIFPAPRQ